MRDRNLTGPWAGFAFKGGRLVTPEGRELEPQDLAWLSLTATLAQEWRRMMAEARAPARPARKALPRTPADVVDLGMAARDRAEIHRPGCWLAPPSTDALPIPAPRPSQQG